MSIALYFNPINLIKKNEHLTYEAIFNYWIFILLGIFAFSSLNLLLLQTALAEGVQITSAESNGTTVAIINFEFQPKNLTVEVGDKVTWINKGARHGVTSDEGSFAATLKNGETFSFTFNKAGKFPITASFMVDLVAVVCQAQ